MANYNEDWSGSTIGNAPTGWTREWHTTGSFTVVDISSDSPPAGANRACRFSGQTTGDRRVLKLDAIDSDPDRATIKVAALVRWASQPNVASTGPGIVARASGTSTSETGLVGRFLSDTSTTGAVGHTRYNNSSSSIGNGTAGPVTVTDWYWLEAHYSGGDVDVFLYPENDPGGTPLLTHSVSGLTPTGVGWAGLFVFSDSAWGDIDYALFAAATGTDPLIYYPGGAPILSSPTGTATGETTATGTVSTNTGSGTLDAVVTQSATTPTSTQIKAGQDHTGAAADATDLNNTVTATGVQNVSFTGLTASTTYYVHYTHEDSGQDSTPVTSPSFTTPAATVEGVRVTLYDGTTPQASITDIHYLVTDGDGPDATELVSGALESTDASGVLEIDLSSTSVVLTDIVYVSVFKRDGVDDLDSLGFQGMLTVINIG